MSEEDLEVLITLDDPGEEALEDDTLYHSQADKAVAHGPGRPTQQEGDPSSE